MCRKIFSAIISCVIIFNTVFCFSFVNAKEINTVPNILYEDESKRGAFEKHFVTSDGSYLATSFPEQVCIKDSNDEWQLIDNTLKKINGRYLTTNGNYSISFPEKYGKDSFIKLKENDLELSWFVTFDSITLNNSKATIVTNRKSNNILSSNNIESHINYYDLSNGIDIEYTVLPYKIKENVILRKETDFSGYKMYIQKNGLVAKLNENNSIIFCDTNGKEKFIIQTPYMYDANYEISYDIELSIIETENEYIISIIPSSEWLHSSFVKYPVTIDPTVRTSTAKANFSDTYVYENSTASESRALEERLRVGIYNNTIYRVLWKTAVLPTIPAPYSIDSASFVLKFPDATTTSRTFSLYKINSAWDSYTVTWSSANSLSKSLIKSNVARNTTANTLTYDVTGTVKNWYSGTANNGFFIRYTSESLTDPDYNLFYSSDNTTSTAYMPYLTISYTLNSSSGLPLSNYPVGSFFTDNGNACSHSDGNYDACSYTNESACNCKIYDLSIQCMGFAKYVYATYAHMTTSNFQSVYNNNTERTNNNRSFSGSATTAKSILQSLPAGSYIRFTRPYPYFGHSVIVVSTDSTSITVYECNQNRICDVGTRTISYSSIANSYTGVEFTMSHNFNTYSQYNSTYHKVLCTNSGCNGYILAKHSTTSTCVCGYSG